MWYVNAAHPFSTNTVGAVCGSWQVPTPSMNVEIHTTWELMKKVTSAAQSLRPFARPYDCHEAAHTAYLVSCCRHSLPSDPNSW